MKAKMLAFASQKFLTHGIRAVAIDDICREMQISKKTFYLYFENKEKLVEEVMLCYLETETKCYENPLKTKHAIDALVYSFNELKKRHHQCPTLLFSDLEKYYPDLYVTMLDRRNRIFKEGLEKNLQQGIAEGYYRTDLDVELYAFYFSHSFRHFIKETESQMTVSKKRLVQFFIDLMARAITNEKGWEYVEKNIIKG